jgi:FKBP-type peptidyl-prolyl cis-trans isomerase
MKRLSRLVTAIVLASMSSVVSATELESEQDKTIYALGVALSRNLAPFNLSESELQLVKQGLSDALIGNKPAVDVNEYGPKFQELMKERAAQLAAVEKEASANFLEKAASEKGAKKTESGLIYKETQAGTGEQPKAADKVKVHYQGTLIDGTVFDSSVERGQPATFPLTGVIKCWTEGLQLMKVGGKSQLICPSDIAYGDRGSPPKIKPGATLIFEVELLEILE